MIINQCFFKIYVLFPVLLAGGVQRGPVVVAEHGAGVGGHRGAVGRAGHRTEARSRARSLRGRRPAGAQRCVLEEQ